LAREAHQIECHLARLLDERGMTLAARVGVTVANLSVPKNDRAKTIRFSTLSAVCRELGCRPGDLLTFAAR
jgi:putative transcriptional regulator